MRSLTRTVLIAALLGGGLLLGPMADQALAASCTPPAGTTTVRGYLSVYEGLGYTGACDIFPVRNGYYNLPRAGRNGTTVHDNSIRSVRLRVGTSSDWYARLWACTGLNLTGRCFATLKSISDLRTVASSDPTVSFDATISSFRVQSVRTWNGYTGTCYCTWGAARLMNTYLSPTQSPRAYPGWRGDAGDWDTAAASTGWAIGRAPRLHSVASWAPGYYPHGSRPGDAYATTRYYPLGNIAPYPTAGHVSWVIGVSADGLWVHVRETGSCGTIKDGGWYKIVGHVARSSSSTVVRATFIYTDR